MQSVAGDNAARPSAPTVRPTKALSMLDRRGFVRYIPKAGMANLSISLLDELLTSSEEVGSSLSPISPSVADDRAELDENLS